ncbi:MAG: DNA mismatch repair protein MutS [Phycisphaerae bacterium]
MSQPPDANTKLSPAMEQYVRFKKQHPEYVLFFRMGDFYEMFWEDAKLAHRVLGVTLTSRSKGGLSGPDAVPMAGVPFHAVEGYLRKMIAAGHKVALCEQVEDAALAKGVVKRDVTRLLTPGTLTDESMLDGRAENHLAAVATYLTKVHGHRAGLAWVELSTGACCCMSGSEGEVLDEVQRLAPAEVLVPEAAGGQAHPLAARLSHVTVRPGWLFSPHHAAETLRKQYQVTTAAGFGFDDDDPAVLALAAAISYLAETQKTDLAHLQPPRRHLVEAHVAIDPASYRALEIDRTLRTGGTEGSVLGAIDRTRTAMGARRLRQWLRHPLRDMEHLRARQSALATLVEAGTTALAKVIDCFDDICDVERVVARLSVGRASPRDLASLRRCLQALPPLRQQLESLQAEALAADFAASAPLVEKVAGLLAHAVLPEPAAHTREGGYIAPGFDAELDRLREISTSSAKWLAEYQQRLANESGITSLKVGYNKVFGYYIEVTDVHRDKVPDAWTRKQTLKGAERYITQELKAFETEALTARDRSIALEQQLFERLRQDLLPDVPALQDVAACVAQVDVLTALASLAVERRYCRPMLTDEKVLKVVEGRHPVLEQQLGSDFVSNDTAFGEEDALQLITGPNMAGKSTYIRQVALVALLAQVGSYVPAKEATVGLVDRIFTRIGASDEIHAGQSTFMVEMTETANILNNATDRSLVILDEIGRGTSTLDGLSLAWAIAEYVADEIRCRTLFATHYHELTALAGQYANVKNLNVAVREWEDQVVFLHRIVEGGTDRSYGIHVARLAGVPRPVLQRAKQLMKELSVQHAGQQPTPSRKRQSQPEAQMQLFAYEPSGLTAALRACDPDELSPREAHDVLRKWKSEFGN